MKREFYKKKQIGYKCCSIIMVITFLMGNLSNITAVSVEEFNQRTVLTYDKSDEGYQLKEFLPDKDMKQFWEVGFNDFSKWADEQGYINIEEAFEENEMIYVSKADTEDKENLQHSYGTKEPKNLPKEIEMDIYSGDGGRYYLWRLCKADVPLLNESVGENEEKESENSVIENNSTKMVENFSEGDLMYETLYFWVRTYDSIILEKNDEHKQEDIMEKEEQKKSPLQIEENKTSGEQETNRNVEGTIKETEEVKQDEKGEDKKLEQANVGNVDVIVTSWTDLKKEVENTQANGKKIIGIGKDFSSTKEEITFGKNGSADIKVTNLGNYTINCETRSDTNAVAGDGGAIRVHNGSNVTLENLKFDGGSKSDIKSMAQSSVSDLWYARISGAWTYYAFAGIKSGVLNITGEQTEITNFVTYADNYSPIFAVGNGTGSDAVLNIYAGRFHNNWGTDGTISETQGKRAITNIYGGEYYNNYARDEALFDLWDGYSGALNFYGGEIHDNYGSAYTGDLSSTVGIIWTASEGNPQNEAQGSIKSYFSGSGGTNLGVKVYDNYQLRDINNSVVALGSGMELASNMGLIWNYNSNTGEEIKDNAQHALVFDMKPEDYLQIGPTTYIKARTGVWWSPSGQIELSENAGMHGAPYAYFADSNPDDGVADGMYLDYADSPNNTMFQEKFGLYEGDLPSGVPALNYDGKYIDKMLYLTNRTADVTYKLYRKQGEQVTEINEFNGKTYPMTKRIGLPEDYSIAITPPVDNNEKYIATEYKWNDEETAKTLNEGATFMKTLKSGGSYTINIYYNANAYKITYDANGGTIDGTETKEVNIAVGESYGTMPIPTKPGYSFAGWYEGPSGGAQVKSTDKPSENTVLYAHWTKTSHEITFEGFGKEDAIIKFKNEVNKVSTKALPKVKIDGKYATEEQMSKMTYSYKKYERSVVNGTYVYGWSKNALQEGTNDSAIGKLPIGIKKPDNNDSNINAYTKSNQSGIIQLTLTYEGNQANYASCVIILPGDVDLNQRINILDRQLVFQAVSGKAELNAYEYQKHMADMNSEAISGVIRVDLFDTKILDGFLYG